MKDCNIFLNTEVSHVTGAGRKEGNVLGIELELEGRNVGLEGEATRGWRREHDGSLRGESIEFVLNIPQTSDVAQKSVSYLFKKFENNKVKFNDSIRTSTHIHLNFSDKPLRQAFVFFSLFTMMEEMMEYYSGEDRGGNLFCLSSRRTDAIVNVLRDCIEKNNLGAFRGDAYKYAACNLSTLYKFGSVEVRTMRGAKSAEQVNNWISILNDMYEYSLKVDAPSDLVTQLSIRSADGFLSDIFSLKNKEDLLSQMPKGFDVHCSLLCGARLIQPYSYEFEEAFRSRPDMSVVVKKGKKIAGKMAREPQPIVRRLSGHRWICRGRNRRFDEVFFVHDERLEDCATIRYNHHINGFEEYDDLEEEWIELEMED